MCFNDVAIRAIRKACVVDSQIINLIKRSRCSYFNLMAVYFLFFHQYKQQHEIILNL